MRTEKTLLALLLAGILTLSGSVSLWGESTAVNSNATVPLPLTIEPVNKLSSVADTLSTLSDSLRAASVPIDTLFYEADSIRYDYNHEQIYLYGNTSIKYGSSNILADSLQVDLKGERAFSKGRTVLQDNDQVLIGSQVYYDTNTQTGLMYDVASKLEKSFYTGSEVRKIDNNIYDVDGGRFTTCDDPNPDFWFWSKELRFYRNDKIVGKPVIAYVNHLPVFYFPFMTFSIKRGRQAGFLIPEPGYNTVDGKFVRDIAYFVPYKDYADATLSFDIFEKTGWKSELDTRYTKLYLLNGDLDVAIQKTISDFAKNIDYSIENTHHQELGNKATLDANINYISSKRIWRSSTNIDQSLARTLTSSVSFRKPVLSSYLNAGLSYVEDLVNNTATTSLPSASYSLPTRPVYEIFTRKSNTVPKTNWWTNFNYSYNVRLNHTGALNQPHKTIGDLLWDNTTDSTGAFLNEHHFGVEHNAGLNYSYKALGWLNLTQGVNYDEVWMDRDRNGVKWVRGNDYSTSTSANFTLYGMRTFGDFPLAAIRHLVTPSASFNLSPDFRDNSRFYNFGGIGLNSGKLSRTFSLGLEQKWQLKLRAKDTETGKDKGRNLNDFLNLTSHISLNPDKAVHKASLLTHSITCHPFTLESGDLKLDYTSTYNLNQDPYKLHWLNWNPQNQYYSHTLSISGNAGYIDYFPRRTNDAFNAYLPSLDSLNQTPQTLAAVGKEEGWSLSLTENLSTDKNILHARNNELRMTASLKVSTNWSLNYSNYYDVAKGKMLSQTFDISRTLHCWKLNISYTRRNNYWDYHIVFLNVALPNDLKFQTRDNKRF